MTEEHIDNWTNEMLDHGIAYAFIDYNDYNELRRAWDDCRKAVLRLIDEAKNDR